MPSSDWSESIVLADWADKECTHLDLIGAWEILLSMYEVLGFTDVISDEQRLVEFKVVIGELNKHLTRMRNGLMKTKSIDDAVAFLLQHANTADMNNVKGRASVAYNKLKQRWVVQSIAVLNSRRPPEQAAEGERADD